MYMYVKYYDIAWLNNTVAPCYNTIVVVHEMEPCCKLGAL